MGTVYGSIYSHYDDQSDDTLNDDLMEILRHTSVKDAIEDRNRDTDVNDLFRGIPSDGMTVNPNGTITRHW